MSEGKEPDQGLGDSSELLVDIVPVNARVQQGRRLHFALQVSARREW